MLSRQCIATPSLMTPLAAPPPPPTPKRTIHRLMQPPSYCFRSYPLNSLSASSNRSKNGSRTASAAVRSEPARQGPPPSPSAAARGWREASKRPSWARDAPPPMPQYLPFAPAIASRPGWLGWGFGGGGDLWGAWMAGGS